MCPKNNHQGPTFDQVWKSLPTQGSEDELTEYIKRTPILDASVCKRVHMQVVIVHVFYHFPDVSNEVFSQVVMRRFPDSNWPSDPNGRATTDRRKYNGGVFRCMGRYVPKNEHVAKSTVRAKEGTDEVSA